MRYTDPDHTMIRLDGGRIVPADPRNRHFAALVAAGAVIQPYAPQPPTANDVRSEASRRMQVLVGARDAKHLDIIISNATREAVRLLHKGSENWTPADTARTAELESMDQAIEAIRNAANAMEFNPPDEFRDDSRWP